MFSSFLQTSRYFFFIALFFCCCRYSVVYSQVNVIKQEPYAAELKPFNGKPTLFINSQPVYPIIYAIPDMPGGRWSWEEVPQWNLTQFTQSGFRLFQVDIWLEDLWKQNGEIDINLARQQIRGVLQVNPAAAISIRLHVNPPRWWQNSHPEECTQFADTVAVPQEAWGMDRRVQGDLKAFLRHSFASRKYLQESGQKLKEFCQKMSQTPEGNALMGLHIADGVYHEWHYWAFFEHYPDTGPAMTSYFREWLRRKYKTDKALKAAWNNPQASFATAAIPGKERLQTSAGVFRNPLTERNMIDYVQAQHQSISDAIIHFCRIAKENWPRPLITGVFYGYFFTMFGRQAAGGHLDVSRILASPYVDYLSGPLSYQRYCRDIGGSGQSRGVIESCRLNGKLWLDEMDQTSSIEQDHENLFIKDLPGDIARIRRNIAQSYTRGIGAWYFDFGLKDVRGWWGNPDLMAEIQKLRVLFEKYHGQPYQSPADVLFVYDTESYYYMGYDFRTDPISPAVIDLPSADAYHSGATLHMVYLHDLQKVNLSAYKVIVFANTFLLTDAQKKFIKTKVAKDGRHLVWNYLPGYTDGNKLAIEFVSEITGIQLNLQTHPVKPELELRTEEFPKTILKINSEVSPLAIITDKQATPLGYLSNESQSVGFAVKAHKESTSWVCSIPLSNPAVFRTIFQKAGVHLYNNAGDVIYDGGGILSVHTLEGGNREITLRNGKKINVSLAPRSTTLFDSHTGEILLK